MTHARGGQLVLPPVKHRLRTWLFAILLSSAACWQCVGAPFAKELRYTQPDGSTIRLWGQGDEFSAVFETLEGYTVVFVPEMRAYCYARVSADGTALESTGDQVGRADPVVLDLRRHERVDPSAARATARAQYEEWDQIVGLSKRWSELKARNLASGPSLKSPPSFTTTGVKCGLTVLIDFEDEPGTISREEISQFLNGDNYTGFGNNGSVKQYFADNSNGRLTFTNNVTPYITIPNSLHPRSYYNNLAKNCFQQGNYLVRDALNVMKGLPNFTNDFLPLFEALTVDNQNKVVSANFFVAGAWSGVWGQGIWPHTSTLSSYVGQQVLWPGGKIVNSYQLSTLGGGLELTPFCHENGHLLCGFPDLYDYGYDLWSGAGCLCLMSVPLSTTSPCQFCAYLKIAAGWSSVVDLTAGTDFSASLSASGPEFNRFFRLRKPGVSTEYFLLENRQKTGWDARISGSGIAVWHIDELGNRDNQSLATNSSHANCEVKLEQADNRWDLESIARLDDPEDLYFADNPAPGYSNAFSDLTSPSAHWWSGARSGLALADFSTNGQTMSFLVTVDPVTVLFDPVDLTVFETQPASFGFALGTITNSNIQWYKADVPLTVSSRLSGVNSNRLTIAAATLDDAGDYRAVINYDTGTATTRVAHLTVKTGAPVLSASYNSQGTTVLFPDGVDLASRGTGIAGASDSCRFAYQQLSGDFDARVRLLRVNMKTTQTRAGLMVRKLSVVNSPYLALWSGLTADGLPCSLLVRTNQGSYARELLGFLAPGDPNDWSAPYACWQRIRREGNRFTCYLSKDGTNWTWLQSLELDLGPELLVGLALAAGSGATENASASFRQYQVLTNTPTSVAIFAEEPTAREGTLHPARVAVYSSRNGPLEAAVRFSGTAIGGRDYLPVTPTVNIPAATNVALLAIAPMNDALASPPKTVEVALLEQPGLEVVTPARATVLVLDDEQLTGGLSRQLCRGIGGWAVADLNRQLTNRNAVTEVGYVTGFETPASGVEYGQVLTGYLVPPETGNYVFYLASDENSELWLSTDENPANARRMAAVAGYTPFRHYLGAGNGSVPTSLEEGKYYFVKALHKQQWFADCFSVAWQLPGGSAPTNGSAPIDGACLAFSAPSNDGLSLSPPAASFSAAPSSGAVAFTCSGPWSAESLDPWIVLSGDTNGTGNGQVAYQVAANASSALRAGTIAINGHTHSVIQAAPPALAIGFNTEHELALIFGSDATVVVEASSDLQTWQPIWTNTVSGTVPINQVDSAAQTASLRFYRTVMR